MILPTKHTSIDQSFLGFGAYLLKVLSDDLAIDELWLHYQGDLSNGKYNVKHSYDNLLLTLAFLFSVDAIYEKNGKVVKCS
jgi:hypothetical protein